MFRNSFNPVLLPVFFSVGSKPLGMWETHCQDGYVNRFLDREIKSMVLDIRGLNVSTTYITCPRENQVLGITLPILVMIVKNLNKYFCFEVTIRDDSGMRRRFRAANFQSHTQIVPFGTVMPIILGDGWNQIQWNLAEFTQRAYKNQFVEVLKLKINSNIRLRKIYFAKTLIAEDDLPAEYRLFFPLSSKEKKRKAERPSAATPCGCSKLDSFDTSVLSLRKPTETERPHTTPNISREQPPSFLSLLSPNKTPNASEVISASKILTDVIISNAAIGRSAHQLLSSAKVTENIQKEPTPAGIRSDTIEASPKVVESARKITSVAKEPSGAIPSTTLGHPQRMPCSEKISRDTILSNTHLTTIAKLLNLIETPSFVNVPNVTESGVTKTPGVVKEQSLTSEPSKLPSITTATSCIRAPSSSIATMAIAEVIDEKGIRFGEVIVGTIAKDKGPRTETLAETEELLPETLAESEQDDPPAVT